MREKVKKGTEKWRLEKRKRNMRSKRRRRGGLKIWQEQGMDSTSEGEGKEGKENREKMQ